VDQRLGRDGDVDRRRQGACALSLCLLTVADAQGLRGDADRSLGRRVSMAHLALPRARQALTACDLVAYDNPFSHVCALDEAPLVPVPHPPSRTAADTPRALKAMFKRLAETLAGSMTTVSATSNTARRTRG
jgi:hypothetical protein